MRDKITGSVTVGIYCLALFVFCIVLSCGGDGDKTKANRIDPKFQQYYNQGELLYKKNCANCHQKNGRGLGRLYPPLDSSDYMSKNFEGVICLIRYGKKGELIVNGVSFNQPMPGIPSLTDLEIAEIATFIYNSWGHKQGLIDVNRITDLMKKCDSEYTGSRN
jgi:cytochrome c551